MRRSPAVAHQFYPGDPATLAKTLKEIIPQNATKKQALAVISPHAGYIYSGGVAGETFSRVIIPEDIILLGPNHHGQGATAALMREGIWDMPLGEVAVNEELAGEILGLSDLIEADEPAHRFEHSLEVQVPFLQVLQKNLRIVPLVISHIPFSACEKIGREIAAAIKNYSKPVLMVASSDMTHYESRQSATAKDKLAIEKIETLDPEGLYDTVVSKNITMCGIIPATITLVAALELGAAKAELVRYTDSGEAGGDTAHVVGYAGLVIS